MASIELSGLVKRYGKTEAVHGIDLQIADGEFVVLVGPSGCGKSTTLRMIAGLEDISEGNLHIGGEVVNAKSPKARNIAMVFQNYAIYPHVSVAQNIAFGLHTSGLSRTEKQQRIRETAQLLGLEDLLDRRPAALSGGQRQRVAIGRAMVRDPVAFLFDEPLSNLDAQLRAQMRVEIKRLHQRLGTTIVYVTHDQVEAMTLADRIVVMDGGKILQVGTPAEVYERPTDVFTAKFIGTPSINLFEGEGARRFERPAHIDAGQNIIVGLRPNDLRVGGAGEVQLSGVVVTTEPLGPETLVHLDVDGQTIVAVAPGKDDPRPGTTLVATASPDTLHFFDAATGKSLGRAQDLPAN